MTLDKVVEEVPEQEKLLVVMDANACTGRRVKGEVGCKNNITFGSYDRNALDDN